MKQLIQKYTDQLAVLKQNKSNTVNTNTDAENDQYDKLIHQVEVFIRELKQLNSSVIGESDLNDDIEFELRKKSQELPNKTTPSEKLYYEAGWREGSRHTKMIISHSR